MPRPKTSNGTETPEGVEGTSLAPPHFIREWRRFRKLTVYELGNLADMSGSMVAQIERGHSRYTERTLVLLAKGLDVEPWRLIAYAPGDEDRFFQSMGHVDYWEGMADNLVPIADEVYEAFVTTGRSLAKSIAKMVEESVRTPKKPTGLRNGKPRLAASK